MRLDDCLSFSPSYHIILKCLDSDCTKGCKKEDVKGLSCLEYSAKIRECLAKPMAWSGTDRSPQMNHAQAAFERYVISTRAVKRC